MDLAGRLLNHAEELSELQSAPRTRRRPTQPSHRRLPRLTEQEVEQLAERYNAGESTRELAAEHDAHRHTITSALRDAGVPLRHKRRRLSDEQVRAAQRRYEAGASLEQLGEQFGVGRETIRRELHRAGVVLRSRGGRR